MSFLKRPTPPRGQSRQPTPITSIQLTWHAGQAAPEALQQYEASRNEGNSIPPMPEAVVSLLKQCLKRNPLERISSLSGAVEGLKAAYSEAIGVEYSRPLQTVTKPGAPQSGIKKRHTREGGIWDDPREWLRMALREAELDKDRGDAKVLQQKLQHPPVKTCREASFLT